MSKKRIFAKSSRSQWVNKANLIFCLTFHIYLTSGEFHCLGDVAVCRSKGLARPWVGVRVCYFLLLLISKTRETHRLNQGTSVGKPKQNGEVYPAKALLLEKMSRERQRKRELWRWMFTLAVLKKKVSYSSVLIDLSVVSVSGRWRSQGRYWPPRILDRGVPWMLLNP